ncbi:MAG TPA: glycosyltransferase [Candidatus Dormibacteraeota bacterium]
MADRVPTTSLLPRVHRVAIISLHTSPTASLGHRANGGLNVYVREVCAAFSRQGVATDVFTRVASPDSPVVESLAPHNRVIYLPAGSPGLGKYELVDQVESFAREVALFAAGERMVYDVIHSHYWLSGAAASSLRARWRIPWAHTAHTLALVKNRHLAPGDLPEPRLRELVEADLARSADLLVVSTEAEGADLCQAYGIDPARIAVVAPGVDHARFRNVPRGTSAAQVGLEGVRPVLFVGRLERLKGAEVALRAFAQGAAGHPHARLLILGDDSHTEGESERERLRGIAADLDIRDRVSFRGSVPHAELPLYYSAAEALLMPSYSESFGLVGLEAQACGCPVIAAGVAGLASVVRDGETGFLIDGHDPADYAARLRQLLDDPELRTRMGECALRHTERFSWTGTGARLLGAYERLLLASRGPQLRVQLTALQE